MLLVVVLRKGKEKKERRIGEKGLARCSLRIASFLFLLLLNKKEKEKKEISDIGNRTRGEHVRDANVTNYTISELSRKEKRK